MPQFSLCYDALDKNLAAMAGSGLGDETGTKVTVSLVILAAAVCIVLLNTRRGRAAKLFDLTLKAMVGIVVICFFGVVALLAINGRLDFAEILAGFVPSLEQWQKPAGKLGESLAAISPDGQQFWSDKIVSSQRSVMIAAAATAVGINMTFLLPYSMLRKGWGKDHRQLGPHHPRPSWARRTRLKLWETLSNRTTCPKNCASGC